MKFLFILLSLPLLYWPQGIETAPQIKAAQIESFAVPPEKVDAWRVAGFKVIAMPRNELEGRQRLLVPGLQGSAAATRAPWVEANGWQFLRQPTGQYLYDLSAGKAALAAAESFVYNADVVIKLEATDLADYGQMLAFLRQLPADELPAVADLTVIDTGSVASGEVMNMLLRRNVLFRLATYPSSLYRLNIKLGTREYPESIGADPGAFALKMRQQLGEKNRAVSLAGSEVVIARLLSDSTKTRLHLLNYGGRDIDELRVRLRGKFANGTVRVTGLERTALTEFSATKSATEFRLPKMTSYALIELPVVK